MYQDKLCTLSFVYVRSYVSMFVCNFRVTNIAINEVDQPLVLNVIEVRTYAYICVYLHSITAYT